MKSCPFEPTPDVEQPYRLPIIHLTVWMTGLFILIETLRLLAFPVIGLTLADLIERLNLFVLIAVVNAVLLQAVLVTTVSAGGLESWDFRGRRLFLPWKTLRRARLIRIPGLPLVRVEDEEGDAVFVARFFGRQEEFDLLVGALLPEQGEVRILVGEEGFVTDDEAEARGRQEHGEEH